MKKYKIKRTKEHTTQYELWEDKMYKNIKQSFGFEIDQVNVVSQKMLMHSIFITEWIRKLKL